MSAVELQEWAIRSERHPLPDPYWIGGQICSVVANANRSKGPAFKVEDFIPKLFVRKRKRQTPEEMLATMQAITRGRV